MAFKDLLTCCSAVLAAVSLLVAVSVSAVAGEAPPLPAVAGVLAGVAVIAVQTVVEKRRRDRRAVRADPDAHHARTRSFSGS